jgi:hypothetical protein
MIGYEKNSRAARHGTKSIVIITSSSRLRKQASKRERALHQNRIPNRHCIEMLLRASAGRIHHYRKPTSRELAQPKFEHVRRVCVAAANHQHPRRLAGEPRQPRSRPPV